MTDTSRHQQFLTFIEKFLSGDLTTDTFCTKFIKLWMQDGAVAREAQQAKKAAWSQPYDELLIAAFQRGELSAAQFQKEHAELWGYAAEIEFQTLIDALHPACSCYDSSPELEWEIDEQQLRREVADRLAAYRASTHALAQAT